MKRYGFKIKFVLFFTMLFLLNCIVFCNGELCYDSTSISKLKNISVEYKEDGIIEVENFPNRRQRDQVQGIFKLKDIQDDVIMDMNLPNEAIPHGAQTKQKVGGWFPYNDTNMPEDYNSINPWGQIFIIDNEDYPQDAVINIRNLTLICYKRSTHNWEIINTPNDIDGLFYKENYVDQSTEEANIEKNENGIKVEINSNSKGRCFHFWTKPVSVDDPSDVAYLVIYCDAYINNKKLDDKFVFNVGADYKKVNKLGKVEEIHEAIGGRFKILKNKTRRVYATNLAYNKYFDICNQNIIDNIKKQ